MIMGRVTNVILDTLQIIIQGPDDFTFLYTVNATCTLHAVENSLYVKYTVSHSGTTCRVCLKFTVRLICSLHD